MIHATFAIASRNNEKYRLYVFADNSPLGLAKKITSFLDDQFQATLSYFSRVSGKNLTKNTSNLGYELEKAHANLRVYTNLLAKAETGALSHFTKSDFEGGFEFNNGKINIYVSLNSYAEGLTEFLDKADLFLYSQGLWDLLPSEFSSIKDEEKAFDEVYQIIKGFNEKQAD